MNTEKKLHFVRTLEAVKEGKVEWKDTIGAVLDSGLLEKRELADTYDLCVATVDRYVSGVSRPHPVMQASIIEDLIQLIRTESSPV